MHCIQIYYDFLYFNGNSTLDENVRYLMQKYDIVNSDWSQNIDILYSKVELYINRLMNINHKCTGSVIREMCETREMTSRMPLITCYAKLNFYFFDLKSLLPRRDTYNVQ